jgi:hypothetical protein
MVAGKLRGTARRVRILDLPNLPLKGDTTDWLEAGGTSGELYQLVSSIAKTYEPTRFVSKFGAFVWGEARTARTPYQYLIKGLIPRREAVLIYGESQSGKSFFTQDIAMAVARGGDYCGRKVRRGLVIYCAAEAGFGFIDLRMPGYAAGKGIDVNEYLPFVCLSKKFDLFGDEKQLIELIAEIKAICAIHCVDGVELEAVVIDTLNKVTPAMDEINGKEVGLVMARLDRIREECRCGLWLVHHKNANGDRPRGHTSLYAAFETALEIGRTGELYSYSKKVSREKRFMKVAKQREGEDGGRFEFCLKGVSIGYDEDGDEVFSAVVDWVGESVDQTVKAKRAEQEVGTNLTAQRKAVYRALRRATDEFGIPVPAGLDLPKSISRVVEYKYWNQVYQKNFAPDDSSETARKAVARGNDFLITNGIISRSNPYVWITGKSIRGESKRPDPVDRDEEAPSEDDATSRISAYFDQGDPPPDDEPGFDEDAEVGDMPIAAMQTPFDAAQIGGPAE